jgi:ring-1,2-phenylacetyl-CoA epoxidase subunit PaaE
VALSFHPLRVAAVERIAEEAACVTLEVPPALREQFKFAAGQYLTVRRSIAGRNELRTYSIVTPPGRGVLKLGVREQLGGCMSGELVQRIVPGDVLDIGTPNGRFRTALDPARSRRYVAFAAGSGITPVLSLATDILERESKSRLTLIYGNRSSARTMFLEEILALKNRFLGRFAVHFVMSREPQHAALMNGRIDAAKVQDLAREFDEIGSADEYFVCGPTDMAEAVKSALTRLNPHATLRLERFATAPRPEATGAAPAASWPGKGALPARELLARISVVMDEHRCIRARGGRAGGAAITVLVSLRNLCNVSGEDRDRRRSHGSQHCARALGD